MKEMDDRNKTGSDRERQHGNQKGTSSPSGTGRGGAAQSGQGQHPAGTQGGEAGAGRTPGGKVGQKPGSGSPHRQQTDEDEDQGK